MRSNDWTANEKAVDFRAAIVESAEDAVLGSNLDGVIEYWNDAAGRLFGYTPGEAVGETLALIVPPG